MPPEITPEYLASQGLSQTFPERFWSKVTKTTSCWVWTAHKNNKGYGMICSKNKSIPILAHRASWILCRGEIPNETPFVLHNCPGGDNPLCVNPDHLWLGTQQDNMEDMKQKGRGCPGVIRNPPGPRSWSRIGWLEVEQIRSMAGFIKQRDIAKQFGITQATVWRIIHNLTWRRLGS